MTTSELWSGIPHLTHTTEATFSLCAKNLMEVLLLKITNHQDQTQPTQVVGQPIASSVDARRAKKMLSSQFLNAETIIRDGEDDDEEAFLWSYIYYIFAFL